MQFYEFGKKENPNMMLLPGTCCHWKNNFGHVIHMLQEYFYVICVSYDGFDENESSIFPDMITETEKIENYVNTQCNGTLFAVYGCSLGGSFVGLLMQRKKIEVIHGFIGSSDLDQMNWWKARLLACIAIPIVYRIIIKGKIPNWMLKKIKTKYSPEYGEAMLKFLFSANGVNVGFVKKQSVYNQFYSDLITPLNKDICARDGIIHCLYARKMGEKYLKRYLRHFANADIIEHDLNHEELLLCYPEQWVEALAKACGQNPV